ncbi:MAG: A/G-specific adenine glycosylase [Acidobacteriaceae bacterium]
MSRGPNPSDFRLRLLGWFGGSARDLPWRRSRDPYAIWISEIMLQQTRVAAVLEHYARFMKRFPTVRKLAEASEQEVLAHWSGLGYYRRARLLHQAAQFVARNLDARLPAASADLRTLPGIGEYTSAAIASIAFGEPIACVDGNVERVLLRIRGWDENSATAAEIRAAAGRLLDPTRPGDFNQAMMELGATVCLPRAPLCPQCPVRGLCATQGEHAVTARKKMRLRHSAYALCERRSAGEPQVLLVQRSADASLMPGMWELPELDPKLASQGAKAITLRHSITDTNYLVSIYVLGSGQIKASLQSGKPREWFPRCDLHRLPLTGLARKVLKRLNAWPESKNAVSGMSLQQLEPGIRV